MLGENVKKLRKELRFSQRELGIELDCGQAMVSAMEREQKMPSYPLLERLRQITKKYKVKKIVF